MTDRRAELEGIKAELCREFPGWSVITTDRGRWWGLRGPLNSEQVDERGCVEADTPEELRARLRLVEARYPKPAGVVVVRLPPGKSLSGPDAP